MERLIFVPIEPLEERYSTQWIKWFREEFKKRDIQFIEVGDDKPREITTGQFLDVYDTNLYKLNQLTQIIEYIKLGFEGTIFFMDLWFPGIETIAYIRDCAKRMIRVEGILHAGTYDPNDFLAQNGCDIWGADLEKCWLKWVDRVYVATDYHKALIDHTRGSYGRIEVVRFPCYVGEQRAEGERLNRVVFPHRLAPEKQPEVFREVEQRYREQYGDDGTVFVRTKDVCKSKAEYYTLLAESKVAFSSALQETFGIAMLEAYNLGCIPVVPDRISYKETFKTIKRYTSLKEAIEMVHNGIHNYKQPPLSEYVEDVSDIVRRIVI